MSSSDNDNAKDLYGAINFGEFRKYMQNKQSKLKKQQQELGNQASQELAQIFKGCSIYVNGYTDPPSSELRKMVLQHGGDYQHYLKKLSVTHIIATNLTSSKLQEFRTYKVVKPSWITESIKQNQLLPWQNHRLAPRPSAQKELLFCSKSKSTTITATSSGEELNAGILANGWARQSTTVNPDFIKKYYQSSRLHYLSTWKTELREIVSKLEIKYPSSQQNLKADITNKNKSRVIMHIDFDCFFASVGIKDRPYLKDKPVAVSHSKGTSKNSSSDIASCNYVARSFGVKNGMRVETAKNMCPGLQFIPYEFEKYRCISEIFYEIIFQYADEIQAVSVDEALINVSSRITLPNTGQEEALATKIRDKIRAATEIEASIGIGSNILLARMSTLKAKPAGQHYCKTQQDIDALLKNQNVKSLPGIGYAIQEKLHEMDVMTIEDIKKISLHDLQAKLGAKIGQTLYNFSRGIDNKGLTTCYQRQSVSAEVNWGVRFENEENEKTFIEELSREVTDRLKKLEMKGKTVTIKILRRKTDSAEAAKHLGHGSVDSFSKSYTFSTFTDSWEAINKHVYTMLKSFQFSHADIRGLGIQITRLDNQEQNAALLDQRKLQFSERVIAQRTEQEEALDNNRKEDESQKKETMAVDYNVFSELPESVKQELKSNYDIRFQESDNNIAEENIYAPANCTSDRIRKDIESAVTIHEKQLDDMPYLPPWSQLDPKSLLALPDTMRQQILSAYGNTNNTKTTGHIPKKHKFTKSSTGLPYTYTKPSSSSSAGPSNIKKNNNSNNTTLTQIFEQRDTICPSEVEPYSNEQDYQCSSLEIEEVDCNAFYFLKIPSELPASDQQVKHSNQDNNQNGVGITLRKQHVKHPKEADSKSTIDHIDISKYQTKEPSLQGCSSITDIRCLLCEWYSSFKESPETEDLTTVYNFLVQLINHSDLEKTRLTILYLDYLTRELDARTQWKVSIFELKERISNIVTSLYGCPLKY